MKIKQDILSQSLYDMSISGFILALIILFVSHNATWCFFTLGMTYISYLVLIAFSLIMGRDEEE